MVEYGCCFCDVAQIMSRFWHGCRCAGRFQFWTKMSCKLRVGSSLKYRKQTRLTNCSTGFLLQFGMG